MTIKEYQHSAKFALASQIITLEAKQLPSLTKAGYSAFLIDASTAQSVPYRLDSIAAADHHRHYAE